MMKLYNAALKLTWPADLRVNASNNARLIHNRYRQVCYNILTTNQIILINCCFFHRIVFNR